MPRSPHPSSRAFTSVGYSWLVTFQTSQDSRNGAGRFSVRVAGGPARACFLSARAPAGPCIARVVLF